MRNIKRIIKNNYKVILYVMVGIIAVLLIIYGFIISKTVKKNHYLSNIEEISKNNESPIFSIKELYLFSSANAIDNSINKNLQDLSLYQYSDISILIDNKKTIQELTNKNTVKQLYIDNINLDSTSSIGNKSLNYTNSLSMGKNIDITNYNRVDRIDFNVIYTNNENSMTDYSKPTFYTDCSNPITLKYLNKNLVSGYKISEGNSVEFNGKMLEKAGISNDELNCKIRFRIVIVNNDDEEFSCWVNFDLPLKDLYSNGKYIKASNTGSSNDEKYNFFLMK